MKFSIALLKHIIVAFLMVGPVVVNGQKIFFGNTPFTTGNAGAKSAFKTNEFIYGRIELPSTVQQYYKVAAATTEKPYPYLYYSVVVYKGDMRMGESSWPFTRISSEDLGRNYWNFDILPDPVKAVTITSGTSSFSSGKSTAPLYSMFNRENFPEAGTYKIEVKIMCVAYDPYDRDTQLPPDKWPIAKSTFDLAFSTDDLPALQDNSKSAEKLVQTNAATLAMKERGLIREWNIKSPITSGITEAELRTMVAAKLKVDTKIIKLATQPSPKGNEWLIEKNNLGVPVMKYHNQPYGVFVKNAAGRCYYIEGNLQKDYAGGGTYDDTYFRKYREDELDCKLIEAALAKGK